MPPRTGVMLPSTDVPAPKAMIGTSASTHRRTIATTSSVELAIDDGVGQGGGEMGLAAAVLEPDRLAELEPVADDRAKPLGKAVRQRGGHDQKSRRARIPTRRRSPIIPRSEAGRFASASVVRSI